VNIAVSPYHLTTREPPAMAALALARRVVTVLPGTSAGEDTARTLPAFSRFMKSWTWTVPLWKAGLLTTDLDGRSPEHDIWDATRSIERDAAYLPLRHFFHQHDHEDPRTYLTALANDLMKGGPDPGISLPVAAGLDRFAARTRCVVARAAASSLAQRAEASLAAPVGSLVVPVFVQANAHRILHYREVLEDQIARFNASIDRLSHSLDEPKAQPALLRDAQAAAAALSAAFEQARDELFMSAGDDDVRPVEGAVSIAAVSLPSDAVFTSSVRAVEHLAPPAPVACAATTTLPALRDELAGRRLLSLVVRPLGRSSIAN